MLASRNDKSCPKMASQCQLHLIVTVLYNRGKYFSKTVRVSNCTKIIKALGHKCDNCESYCTENEK